MTFWHAVLPTATATVAGFAALGLLCLIFGGNSAWVLLALVPWLLVHAVWIWRVW